MAINVILLVQTLVVLAIWAACCGYAAYYIDRANPSIAKKSALIAIILAFVPLFAVVYLIYLYVSRKYKVVPRG